MPLVCLHSIELRIAKLLSGVDQSKIVDHSITHLWAHILSVLVYVYALSVVTPILILVRFLNPIKVTAKFSGPKGTLRADQRGLVLIDSYHTGLRGMQISKSINIIDFGYSIECSQPLPPDAKISDI